MQDLNLTDKFTVITGGSSGIGKQTAMTFAEHGSNIAIVDINEDGKKVVATIRNKYKRYALYFPCDISDYNSVAKASSLIIKNFKRVDNLICAAGYGSKVDIENLSKEEWKKSIDVNVNGIFYIVKSLLEMMLEQKNANIILIGSATVVTGSGGGLHYATSKVAQYGILKGLSYELLSRGIRTNIITPHLIDTPMLRKRYPNIPEILLQKRHIETVNIAITHYIEDSPVNSKIPGQVLDMAEPSINTIPEGTGTYLAL